jgi:hypothetical protein
MTMHILAHLYFGDLMRCVFCILDMFVIQNKDIARLSGLIQFVKHVARLVVVTRLLSTTGMQRNKVL